MNLMFSERLDTASALDLPAHVYRPASRLTHPEVGRSLPPNTMATGPRGDAKPFTAIAVIGLSLIALLQLLRFALKWEVTLNGAVVPVWLSGIAFVVTGALAVMVWREHRR
jgi:hypothetical protein